MSTQIDIFDFIEKPPEQGKSEEKTQFEEWFNKVENPVLDCVNCLCHYCVNNAEDLWRTVKPEEVKCPCFKCDECKIYDGDCRKKKQLIEECVGFVISKYGSDHMVRKNRKEIRLIK